ncbi:hypothetical protein EV207_1157 [Scopulibacillus darangshiensis]|uniref:Tetratricopeptide repeat protein n=1 Tax=Scopulibacillus darangshiensis TaxID=442528 RepID=A0A4R2P2D2_9BACL|nr:hypothetical protein [Scopulibacillus darangshiensis]TCP28782.1 hypothetical protein EV207_1157 [Scopulibacillus darangshiensis]
MFNFFKNKKPRGLIKYFGLTDLWLNELTEEQREEVRKRFDMGMGINRDSVDKEEISSTSMLIEDFLIDMAQGISDPETKIKLLDIADNKGKDTRKTIIDDHYVTMGKWQEIKKMAYKDNRHYPRLIKILKHDCAIYDEFKIQYFKENKMEVTYPAFKELALAYERTGEYEKAIEISKIAIEKEVKEHTSFERRINKLEKKLI